MTEPPKEILPDYRYDPIAYEREEKSRPDEMAMIRGATDEAMRYLDRTPHARVLELCCGTGLPMREVVDHRNVDEAVGVDNCDEYLAFAKKRFQGKSNVRLINDDAVTTEQVPLHNWDVILLCSAYHHIEDARKPAFLKHVHDLLKEGGVATMAENILPPYKDGDAQSYRDAVRIFYTAVLKEAKRANPNLPKEVEGLIKKIAEYGDMGDYEYKVHFDHFKKDLAAAGLHIKKIEKVWPKNGDASELGTGGNYVLVLEAANGHSAA
jgi:ubiquinone/menaquinone biosynthesis C-methylase UbiE